MVSSESVVDLFMRPVRLATPAREVGGQELVDSARQLATGVARYGETAGVLVAVADPIDALTVALAAWWENLRVAFARPDSPHSVQEQAVAVGASAIVADEHSRESMRTSSGPHLAVTTLSELVGNPVSGFPKATGSDCALDVLTSGTTGRPRCVTFTHAALVANASGLAGAMTLGRRERIWTPLPHSLPGMLCTVVLTAAHAGGTALLETSRDYFRLAASLSESAASVVYAVPELYEGLARAETFTQEDAPVRWWLSSSSHMSPPVFDRMLSKRGALVRSFYCASETGTVTFNDSDEVESVRMSVGRPLPGVEVHVRLPPGESEHVGSIVVGGSLVALGHRVSGRVVHFPTSGVATTDRGRFRPDGTLEVVGRDDDRVHIGGEVIDPYLVECHIGSLAGVLDCMVVGRPHGRLGHVLEARVVREPGREEITERSVVLHCRARGLKGPWIPRSVLWVDSIPRTAAGKPARKEAVGGER